MRTSFMIFAAVVGILIVAMGICPLPGNANPVTTDYTEVRLISETASIKAGTPFWVAVRLKPQDGWHTYWRNPGDTGLATTIQWQLPQGFTASDIVWPHPERITVGPLMNYGYHGETYLLIRIDVPADVSATGQVGLQADVKWLVCSEKTCVPEQGLVKLSLPLSQENPPRDPQWQKAFATARQALPKLSPWSVYLAEKPQAFTLMVRSDALSTQGLDDAWFLPLQEGLIDDNAPQTLTIYPRGLSLDVPRGDKASPLPERLQGLLLLKSTDTPQTQAFHIEATVEENPLASQGRAHRSLLLLIKEAFLAFLGGIILNLMPCIFPILSIKVLSVVQHCQQSPGDIRRQGLVFTAGVLVCFSLIALILIGLRAGGAQIGWGFQLQSPGFVMLLAYLLFAMALSLSGAFTIGNTLMGVGSNLADRPGYGGAFATGALATVVATPCTAPFMGAALGYALSQPWYTGLVIFQSMGLGLAFPYLLLTFNPRLFRFLPRPGPWMERLKEFLAFPLYATVIWLLWVLSLQAGPSGILAALIGLLLINFAAWLWRITRAGSKTRVFGSVGVTAVLLGAIGLTALPESVDHHRDAVLAVHPSNGRGPAWEPFSKQRLAEHRAANRPVFVNFTAAWCITCLANERVALSSTKLAEHFAEAGVVYLKADWTSRDPEITQFLNAFGRSGVPLYVYYPPKGTKPVVLPQILSEAIVLQKLKLVDYYPVYDIHGY